MLPSSQDLHPKSGARFVFEREDEAGLRYALLIYLPEQRLWRGGLRRDADGSATIEDESGAPVDAAAEGVDEALRWAFAEGLKLARVLRKDPKPRLTRWRG
ncbi:hypothetical protein PPSIR1_27778 [Plesiocystis pacifica SIR-1]|uniref:Uncharacterized protein n=1 Tax=Plesiocystis pacifica SIR-1 TaxID=391625 RepID=A6GI71_9BACT|nr:hypothetical protein [Plesiocystis pacifica]EDM74415.1 hypothetical protein PPSIR1_27778 [Plesiocystis pacifica SIR-1]